MKLITTDSGSVYELDEDQKRIRRLSGAKPPTPRQGSDGEWRQYEGLDRVGPEGAQRLMVIWRIDEDEGFPDVRIARSTLTSTIKSEEYVQ